MKVERIKASSRTRIDAGNALIGVRVSHSQLNEPIKRHHHHRTVWQTRIFCRVSEKRIAWINGDTRPIFIATTLIECYNRCVNKPRNTDLLIEMQLLLLSWLRERKKTDRLIHRLDDKLAKSRCMRVFGFYSIAGSAYISSRKRIPFARLDKQVFGS